MPRLPRPTAALALLGLLAAAPPATAQPAPAATARPTTARPALRIPFERFTLPNGLTVILAPDRSTPVVTTDIWYHVGSSNEVLGRTGFAHMFEHVMFTGSGHVPYGTHDRLTSGVGGTNNGSTSNDRTNYYETVPSNYLGSALWLEADRMGYLLDKLDAAKFAAQRDVVQNERRQRVDNVPYGRVGEITSAALYPASHPYSWPVVGHLADLQAAQLDDVKQFFRTWYAPNNATLAIVGDFDPDSARTWVRRWFGDLPRGRAITRPTVTTPALAAERRLTYEDRVQVPRLYLTWHTVGERSADRYALDVLGSILAGERTARLTKALVYDRQLAANVGAFQSENEHVGTFRIIVTPRPGTSLETLEQVVDSIVARIAADGPTADEITRTKAGLEYDFVSGLESTLGKAETLLAGQVFHGDAAAYQADLRGLQAVTAADVKRVAARYLTDRRLVLSVVPLGKPEMASKAAASTNVTNSAAPSSSRGPEARP